MAKLIFDSTATTKGLLFQFLIALEKCFEMGKGQSVYIETYGDVSLLGDLSNSKQIESKFYKKPLTNLDKNVWNTIHNWMCDEFPIDKFGSLVLLTTQKVSKGSVWENWNDKSIAERLNVLMGVKNDFDNQEKQSKELKKCMDVIFDSKKSSRLATITNMLFIDCCKSNWNDYRDCICDKYGKGIPKIQKERFIDSLFGYILRPQIVSNNWEITFDAFSKEVKELTNQLVESTTMFPTKQNLVDIKHEEYEENKFVRKIQDINYEEVIPRAIDDYVHTITLVEENMKESEVIQKSLSQYEENIERKFRTKYRNASRNYNDGERIVKSQDLYDDITSSNDGTFHSYHSVPDYFHSGMVHLLTEEKDDLIWLLKEKVNE